MTNKDWIQSSVTLLMPYDLNLNDRDDDDDDDDDIKHSQYPALLAVMQFLTLGSHD